MVDVKVEVPICLDIVDEGASSRENRGTRFEVFHQLTQKPVFEKSLKDGRAKEVIAPLKPSA